MRVEELNEIYCNAHQPPATLIAAPTLSIRFHSDSIVSGKGFLLKYKSRESFLV